MATFEARMRDLARDADRLRTEIDILVEQVAFQREVADDARLRALISETPIADRDVQEATGDLRRLESSLGDARASLTQVTEEMDLLLERLLEAD